VPPGFDAFVSARFAGTLNMNGRSPEEEPRPRGLVCYRLGGSLTEPESNLPQVISSSGVCVVLSGLSLT
jgi:hypothetical protein